MLKLKANLLIKELILFSATLAVGIYCSYYFRSYAAGVGVPAISFTWKDLIFLAIFILSFVTFFKNKKISGFYFRFILGLVVFVGCQIIFGILFMPPLDLVLAIVCVVLFFIKKSVLVHNLGVMAGVVGIGSTLGFSMTPMTAVFILASLSVYDIIAVYKTKHMISLARAMMESGALFGFIIPEDFPNLFADKREAQANIGERFMILGSGDVVWPMVLVSSVALYSIGDGIIVGVFSLAGLLLTHLIFVNQAERRAMAALPPIATMAIIGYLLTLI